MLLPFIILVLNYYKYVYYLNLPQKYIDIP